MRCRYHCACLNLYHVVHLLDIFSAYQLYADPHSGLPPVGDVGSQDTAAKADRFKKAFSHKKVTVHFVGAWCVISITIMTTEKQNEPL